MEASRTRLETLIALGKDTLALVRDGLILLMLLLLLGSPVFFRDRLVQAGIVKGNLLGVEFDLLREAATDSTAELAEQKRLTEELKQRLAETQKQLGEVANRSRDPAALDAWQQARARNEPVQQAATAQGQSASRVIEKAGSSIARALVETPVQASADVERGWAVVMGGDTSLEQAQHELARARRAGLANASVVQRDGWFRTVAQFASQDEATRALAAARNVRADSYLIDWQRWCPSPKPAEGHRVCG